MQWWLWLILGLFLMLLELLTPAGFYLFFFGLGALAVGLIALVGFVETAWAQWLAFSGLSLVALGLFREPLARRFRPRVEDQDLDGLVGEVARALEDIGVDGIGRAELRGSTWQARNIGPGPVVRDQRCKVEKVEGLVLLVRGN